MMTQRPFNMHVGIYTKTLCDDLRKCLLITLTLLFVCPGVWGDNIVYVESESDFGTPTDGRHMLGNGNTYVLNNDITLDDNCLYIDQGKTVIINLNGHSLTRSSSTSSAAYKSVFWNYKGTLTIMDSHGGGVIHNENSPTKGGGIYNIGTLYFKGGTILNCSASYGGGIFNDATSATEYGTLYLEGGTITGNTANNLGGGIDNCGHMYIKGSPTVTNNTRGGNADNLNLGSSKVAISGPLSGTSQVGVTVSGWSAGPFTKASSDYSPSATDYLIFISDNAEYKVGRAADNNATIMNPWEMLQDKLTTAATETDPSKKTVTLDKNYTAASYNVPLEVSGGSVTLALNGYTIDRGLGSSSAASNGEVINVTSTGNLTITGTGTITGGNVNGNGGAIINAGTLDIQGGTITGNSATGNGGAVFNTGTATISGGTLSSNSASQGGAVYNNGTLTVSSGAIQNNTASTNGGGIYHYDGTLNMSGAPTISGNQKGTADNNVYLASEKTITVNEDLTNTTAIGITMAANIGVFTTGLGSYTGNYQNFTSDDARFVTANSSGNAKLQTYWMDLQEKLDAGNVILARNYEYLSGFDNAGLTVSADRTLNLGSYKIDRKLSTATENGYVIKVTGGTLTVTGTGQITGGNNSGNGGGIFVDGGTLVLSGGNITGNTAALGGGVYNGGTLQMSGAPIVTGNTGGNVYLPDGHSIITLVGTMNGSDGNIGITMLTPGVFTSGMNTYGTISKFASDNGDYEVAPNGDEATLLSHWAALKATLAKGGTVNLTRDYVAPSAGDGYLEVPNTKTVALDLKGHTINRHLTEATADGYVIKVAAGGTLTISDSGTGGAITGGNNSSDADGQRGGGICNLGTVNLQGGIISGNQSVKGGGIYNENTLNISGGTIESNTATTGGGIYNNGATFTMSGAPNISGNTGGNTYLPAAHPTITISAALSNTTAIGITMETNGVFTSGLSGKGNASNFALDNSSYGIGLNSSNEAVIGNKYTITRNEPNDTYTYMYIKGNYIDNSIEAVAGEYIKVTISGDGTYHTIPVSLSYTDGTLSTYPKGGVEYGFNMPNKNVTVTGVCRYGGYCGDANNEDVKYYLEGTMLKFQAKDAGNYAMKSTYASQNEVPWYSRTEIQNVYTSVEIPSNITNISPYAFYGSGLTTADIPASVNTIGTKAFMGCTSLTAINVNVSNPSYMNNSDDGVLYTKFAGNPTNLICYPAGKSDENYSYSVPSTVTAITDGAFAFNNLKSITVAGGSSFSAPNDNGVLYNAGETILYCYPARKEGNVYDVAPTVTEIKPYAFHNNNLLKVVNFCENAVPTGGEEMFGGTIHNDLRILVKNGLKVGNDASYYQGADYWKDYYTRIYEMNLANASVSLEYTTHKYEDTYVKPGVNSVKITVGGQEITLREDIDYVTISDGSYTNNNAVGTATVTVEGKNGYYGTSKAKNFTITRELIISGADNRYTYFASEDLTLPSHLTAWTYTAIDWETGVMTATQINYIPANVPVILHRSGASINETLYLTAHAGGTHANPIQYYRGTATAKDIDVLKTEINTELHEIAEYIYVLRGENFVRATSGTLPAKHCYLYKPSGTAAPSVLTTTFSAISGGSYKIETLNASNGTVNIQYDNSGTPTNVTVNDTEIPAGKTVTLTITPSDGFYLSALQCEEVTTLGVAMAPARRADKTQEIHKININTNYEGHFAGTYTFPMPRNNVIVTATFAACTSITSANLHWDSGDGPQSKVYDGAAHTMVVKVGDTELTKDRHYTTTDYTLTNVGSINPTITGIGEYNGSISSTTLSITQQPLTITAKAQTISYGSSIETGLSRVTTVGLVTGDALTSITLTPSTSQVTDAGTITPSAANTTKGISNYAVTYNTGALTIQAYDLSAVALSDDVLDIDLDKYYFNYDGSLHKAQVTSIKYQNTPLASGTSYTYDYAKLGVYTGSIGTGNEANPENPVDYKTPDIYTIVITFCGNYTGTKTVEYQIRPEITLNNNNGHRWRTYYNQTYNMEETNDFEAFTVSSITTNSVILNGPREVIKSATPMLFYRKTGTASGIYPALIKPSDARLDNSYWTGASTYLKCHVDGGGTPTDWDLDNDGGITGGTTKIMILVDDKFAYSKSGTLAAGKCYLDVSPVSPSPAPSLFIGTNPTGIEEETIKDFDLNGVWYTLDGRQIQGVPAQKGIYIKNGKKIIIK